MLGSLVRRRSSDVEARSYPGMSWSDYLAYMGSAFSFNGFPYLALGSQMSIASEVYSSNAAVGACVAVRTMVFSEITFKWQAYRNSKPANLYGTEALAILDTPWPGAGTSHLLAAMEVDVSIFGNSYWLRRGAELVRLDPTKVTIATAEVDDGVGNPVSQRLVGYSFQADPQSEPVLFSPQSVAHYRILPDPMHPFRGTSWLRMVLEDADSDTKMTQYKSAFLKNAATPNLVVSFDGSISAEQFEAFKTAMDAGHKGWDKVGKTLYLGSGADVKVVGSNWQDLNLKQVQGAGESRIAAAAGVPASIVGFSEGLQGSALNSGNYGAARRRFADGTIRPLWRAACTALSTIVPPPAGSRLWFDASDVSFLQEDEADEATIRQTKANTMRQLIDAGYDPDAAATFAAEGDARVLVGSHSGLFSVQLQPAGTVDATSDSMDDDADDEPQRMRSVSPQLPVQLDLTFNLPEQSHHTTVHVPEQRADVVVNVPEQRQEAPQVTVVNQVDVPSVQVDVAAPSVSVTNDVQPAVPEVRVEPSAANVVVEVPEPRPTTHRVRRDREGRIVEVVEE